jgi:hypothetical protein
LYDPAMGSKMEMVGGKDQRLFDLGVGFLSIV